MIKEWRMLMHQQKKFFRSESKKGQSLGFQGCRCPSYEYFWSCFKVILHFLLFCLFAEDLNLLPNQIFSKMVQAQGEAYSDIHFGLFDRHSEHFLFSGSLSNALTRFWRAAIRDFSVSSSLSSARALAPLLPPKVSTMLNLDSIVWDGGISTCAAKSL